MKKIIFVNSHPIQYFGPLYKFLHNENVNLEVWYGSDSSIKGYMDKGFSSHVKWDIPVLEGYNHRFFRNHSPRPSINDSFWGVINWGLLQAIWKEPKSVFVVPGWQYFSYILCLIWAKICGHTVCIRGEMPHNQEVLRTTLKNKLKLNFLRNFLFRFVDYFLYIGSQNKSYYQNLGIEDDRLVYTPYAVDNDRFKEAYNSWKDRKNELRKEFGIGTEEKVILFSGKYISKKRPLDLLKAFQMINDQNARLVMVGDGELRPEMEEFIREHKLDNVILTGFINQGDIVKYYPVADVFVMCSEIGETWGLSVNEAMNFGLPIVISHLTGCASDLVEDSRNGMVFPTGDASALSKSLKTILEDEYWRKLAGNYSLEKISNYSYNNIKVGLLQLVRK